MSHEPGRLVCDAKHAVQLVGAHAFLRESKRFKQRFLHTFGDARTLRRYLACRDDRRQISTVYAKQMSLLGVPH